MKERKRLLIILMVILLFALFNNYFSRKYYDKLDKNMSSIYQDRLMPTSYLFRLSDHLYQKKLLLPDVVEGTVSNTELKRHNDEILKITEAYEKTYLTGNEQRYWEAFTRNLKGYNEAEKAYLAHADNPENKNMLSTSFLEAMVDLNKLNEIQTIEGLRLQSDSKEIIGSTLLGAYFEISLLFILAIIALRILTTYERSNYPAIGASMMN